MKGIVLSGGLDTRLHPLTISCSKQLLPIYDKPMIYYPISTLINMGIKEILLICKKIDLKNFYSLLGNGNEFGIKIKYEIQDQPKGIAESFLIGEKFIKNDKITLILGDNIFHGLDYKNYDKKKSTIFLYEVPDPQNYGVATIKKERVIKIEEKPKNPKSNMIVTGLYIYNNDVIKVAKKIKPSKRNELEITDINNYFIKKNKMTFKKFGEGSLWLDAGNPESLFRASEYVKIIQERHQTLIGSPHYSAFKNNLISKSFLSKILSKYKKTIYEQKLRMICNL